MCVCVFVDLRSSFSCPTVLQRREAHTGELRRDEARAFVLEAHSDRVAPDHRAPDHRTPDRAAPDHRTPDSRAPDRASPDHRAPNRVSPDHRAPDRGGLDHRAPDRGNSDHRAPDRGTPDRGAPDRGIPDRGTLDAVPRVELARAACSETYTARGLGIRCGSKQLAERQKRFVHTVSARVCSPTLCLLALAGVAEPALPECLLGSFADIALN